MNDDVTIPRETAAGWARWLLHYPGYDGPFTVGARQLADLLDPKPRSLRDEVAMAAAQPCAFCSRDVTPSVERADAVLAVVADWLAVQPINSEHGAIGGQWCCGQRDHDVRLLRGES